MTGGLNTYAYVGGNPVKFVDPEGLYIDTPIDLGFIGYDAYRLVNDNVIGNCGNLGENLLALGADILGALLPGVTGLGLGIRSVDNIVALVARNADDVAKRAATSLDDLSRAGAPVGRKGAPLQNAPYQPTRNASGNIGGRDFSGHALDQMQNRGITPRVVENAIKTGASSPGKRSGTTVHIDKVNKVRVVTNSETGNVITVIPGVK